MLKDSIRGTPSCSILAWLFHSGKQTWVKSNLYWYNWIYVSAFSGITMLVKTLHTSNWPDIAGKVLHIMSPQIYLPQAFLPVVLLGLFVCSGWFCTKSGAQHAKMLSRWPACTSEYLGTAEHSQHLCEPRSENTNSSLLLLGAMPCRAFLQGSIGFLCKQV